MGSGRQLAKHIWPHPDAVRSWQRQMRRAIEAAEVSQAVAARRLHVSQSTLESWLADPASSWHRRPSYPEKTGAITIVSALRWDRKKPKERLKLKLALERRRSEWPGRTLADIAQTDGLSTTAVYRYAKRHGIPLKLREHR